ncbi:MAG TPA: Sec-independent protein translocase protein TatB [Methylophilaceae bacterium]
MFDVAFSELVVIAIVALIVIGPEKLPKVARTLGALAGRMQRYVSSVKADIEREMQYEDLQKLQQEIRQGVNQAKSEVGEVENSIGGLTQAKKPDTPGNTQ